MTGFQVFLVAYFAFSAAAAIALVGHERKPITPETAIVSVAASAALIWATITFI